MQTSSERNQQSARKGALRWIGLALAAALIVAGIAMWWPASSAKPDFADLAYAAQSERQKLDIYLPDTATRSQTDQARPIILWIHGGAFKMGSKDSPPSLERLRQEGFVVAAMNYRLSDEAKWPAQLDDLKAAVRYLKANAKKWGANGDEIGVWGASAGGHLATMTGIALAADPQSRVAAVADFYGPIDFANMDKDMAALGRTPKMGVTNRPGSAESLLIGGNVATDVDKAWAASPLMYLQALSQDTPPPPFLILHGDADAFIAHGQSQRLHAALTQKYGPQAATMQLVPGGEHGGAAFETTAVEDQLVGFFRQHLR